MVSLFGIVMHAATESVTDWRGTTENDENFRTAPECGDLWLDPPGSGAKGAEIRRIFCKGVRRSKTDAFPSCRTAYSREH